MKTALYVTVVVLGLAACLVYGVADAARDWNGPKQETHQ